MEIVLVFLTRYVYCDLTKLNPGKIDPGYY